MNRRFVMQEHYQKYLEGDDNILSLKKEEDPFWEPVIKFFSNF
jgi:kinesin family protein 1